MAKYRTIQVDFWEDGFVLDLTPEEKYFYLYLLSNSRTTQCGCYELPYKVIEMQTGYNRETVEKLLQRFVDYGKIEYSADTKEILIRNWHKFNFTKSPKVMNCIIKEISAIKKEEFKELIYTVFRGVGFVGVAVAGGGYFRGQTPGGGQFGGDGRFIKFKSTITS